MQLRYTAIVCTDVSLPASASTSSRQPNRQQYICLSTHKQTRHLFAIECSYQSFSVSACTASVFTITYSTVLHCIQSILSCPSLRSVESPSDYRSNNSGLKCVHHYLYITYNV